MESDRLQDSSFKTCFDECCAVCASLDQGLWVSYFLHIPDEKWHEVGMALSSIRSSSPLHPRISNAARKRFRAMYCADEGCETSLGEYQITSPPMIKQGSNLDAAGNYRNDAERCEWGQEFELNRGRAWE